MAKQLNINLAMTADTSKAKAELQSLQKQLNNLMTSSIKNDNSLGLSPEIQKATQLAAQLKVQLESATSSTGKLDLTKFNESLQKSGLTIKDYRMALTSLGPEGSQAFSQLASSIMQAEVPLKRTNTMLSNFAVTLKNTARWQISSSILHGFMGALQGAYGYAQDLNESLNNIRIVTGQSVDQMAKFAEQANKSAKELSTTTTAYSDAALIYYQQGLSDKDVAERTNTTIKLANVSRQSAEEVSSQMTAIWNNFDDGSHKLEYYADVITALGAKTASSSSEIAEGLQKFSAVADTVGLSYEKSTAALATVVAETRQSADVVGTAFKTMFARIEGLSLGETLEDGVNLNKYSEALKTVGVNILDSNKELKDMDVILDELGKKWSSIGESQQVALAQTVAGTRQYSQFMALMNNYDKVLSNQKIAEGSEGTLQGQADTYAESWEAASKRVKAAAQGIYQDLLDDKFFIQMLNWLEKIISFFDSFIKNLGGLKGVLLTLGAILTQVFSSQIQNSINNIVSGIQKMTPAGRAAAQKVREDANKELREMAVSSDLAGTQQGEAMSSAYKQQGELQDLLLQKSKSLTEEQLKQAQILLDINKKFEEEAIQAGKAADEAKRQTDALAEQQARRAGILAGPENKKEARVAVENAQTNVKQAFQDRNAFEQGGEKAKEIYSKLKNEVSATKKDLQKQLEIETARLNKAKEQKKKYSDIREEIEKIEKQIKEIDEKTPLNIFNKDFENLDVDDIQEITDMLDDNIETAERGLLESFENSNIPNATQEVSDFDEACQDMINTSNEAADAQERMNNTAEATEGKFNNFTRESQSYGTALTNIGTATMNVAMAINSIKSIGAIWSNDDISTGEKLLQTMMSLSTILPVLTTLTNKEKLEDLSAAAAKILHMEATEAHAAAEAGSVAPKTASAAATWALLAPIVALAAAIGAIIGVIALLVNAFKSMEANSPEQQFKNASEAAKELSDKAEEAKSKAEKLKNAFSDYQTIVDKLNACTKGTQEWRDAMSEAQAKVRDLIKEFPEFLSKLETLDDGTLGFSEDTLKEIQALYDARSENAQNASLTARVKASQKELETEKKDILDKTNISFNTDAGDGYVTSSTDNGAGIIAKTVVDNADYFASESIDVFKEKIEDWFKDSYDGLDIVQTDDFEKFYNSINDLSEKTRQVAGDMDNASTIIAQTATQKNYSNKNESDQEAITKAGSAAYQKKYDEIYNSLQAMKKNYNNDSWDADLNTNENAIWHRWLKSQGYSEEEGFRLDKDALNTDDQGKLTVTYYDPYQNKDVTERYDVLVNQTAAGLASATMAEIQKNMGEYLDNSSSAKSKTFMTKIGYDQKQSRYDTSQSFMDYTYDERQLISEQLKSLEGKSEWKEMLKSSDYEDLLNTLGMTADELIQIKENTGLNFADLEQDIAKVSYLFTKEEKERLNTLIGDHSNLTGTEKSNLLNADNTIKENLKKTRGLSESDSSAIEDIINDKANKNVNTKNLVSFYTGLKDIDFASDKAADKVSELAKKYGISGDSLTSFTNKLKGLDHSFETSTTSIEQTSTELGKIIKSSTKAGDIFTKENLDYLEKAGINTDVFFTKMQDGTYKLNEKAEELKDIVENISSDKLKEVIKNIGENKTEKSENYDVDKSIFSNGNITNEQKNDTDNAMARLSYASSFENAENIFADISNSAGSALDLIQMFQNNQIKSQDLTKQQIELINQMIDATDNYEESIQEQIFNNATTVSELQSLAQELKDTNGSLDYDAYSHALISLATQYDNTTQEIKDYEEALKSGDITTIEAAEDALTAATLIGEAAKKYSIDTEDTETQARLISKRYKETHDGAELSATSAARLAIANQRLNSGVKTLHDNWETWSKTLKNSNHTTKDYAEALNDANEALANLVGAIDGASIPIDFLDNTTTDGAKHLEWMTKAAEGDTQAINKLGVAVAAAAVKEMEFSESIKEAQKEAEKTTTDDLDPIENAFGEIITETTFDKAKNILDNFISGFQNAVAQGTNTAQAYLNNYEEDWISALNEMALATGMSVDEMNALLNELGVETKVTVKEVKQKVSVPEYTTIEEAIPPDKVPGQNKDKTLTGKKSHTYISGYKDVYQTMQVAQIDTEDGGTSGPTVTYTGTSGSSAGYGGVSSSSTADSSSSKKTTSAASTDHSVNRYSKEENAVNGLTKQLERLSAAKDNAYGNSKIKAIEKEIAKLKELKSAQEDYLDAVVGSGNAKGITQAIYQGKSIGQLIASGQTGGTIKADYQSLFGGASASGKNLEYTAKDDDGNQWLVSDNYSLAGLNSAFGTSLGVQLDSYGNILNKDDLLNIIQRLKNQENLQYASYADPSAGQITEHNKRIAYLEEFKERLEQYEDTATKLNDLVDEELERVQALQEKNAELISAKMSTGVELGKNSLTRLERAVKLLGDDTYKSVEKMTKFFDIKMNQNQGAYAKQAASYDEAEADIKRRVALYQKNPLDENALSPSKAAEMIQTIEDGRAELYENITSDLEDLKNAYGNVTDYWKEKIDKVNKEIEFNVSTLSHLSKVFSLLGKSADYESLGVILDAQAETSLVDYNDKKRIADSARALYEEHKKVYNKLKTEKQREEYESAILEKDREYLYEVAQQEQAALETLIEAREAQHENNLNKIYQRYEQSLAGEYGTFDNLDQAMKNQQSLADEYLTTTNKVYETNKMLRSISQDIEKTDSRIAKNKLKSFSDEINALQKRDKLTKNDLALAQAKYKVLQAQIALEEARDAKTTVRLKRDSEGNYGYVYTADQDKISNAEQAVEDAENEYYNLNLQQYNDYNEKYLTLKREYAEQRKNLDKLYYEDGLLSEDQYNKALEELNRNFQEKELIYKEAINERGLNLDEIAADGRTEAWTNSFTETLAAQELFNDKSLGAAQNLNSALQSEMQNWVSVQKTLLSEAGLNNRNFKQTVKEVKNEVESLGKQITKKGGFVDQMNQNRSATEKLTEKFILQYQKLENLADKYLRAANEASNYRDKLISLAEAQRDYNAAISSQSSVNASNGGGQPYTPTGSGSGNGSSGDGGSGNISSGNDNSGSKGSTNRESVSGWKHNDTHHWRVKTYSNGKRENINYEKHNNYWTCYSSSQNPQDGYNYYYYKCKCGATGYKKIKTQLAKEYNYTNPNMILNNKDIPFIQMKSGGYTGSWNGANTEENGKLAFLHQKELVLNADDTKNMLSAVKLIRQINQSIDLQAAAQSASLQTTAAQFQGNDQTLQQEVTIHAEFPNATDHNEIEEAFNNLVNRASQYANRF